MRRRSLKPARVSVHTAWSAGTATSRSTRPSNGPSSGPTRASARKPSSATHSCGAQIAASHNPTQYNGVKLVREGAFPLSGASRINDIRDMITGGELPAPSHKRGDVTHRDTLHEYVKHVMSFIDPAIIKP